MQGCLASTELCRVSCLEQEQACMDVCNKPDMSKENP